MSHNGVRFVTAEEAAADLAREQRRLSGEALRPAKVRVDKSGGTGLFIEWRDGQQNHWPFRWLREACPCAVCHDAREAEGRPPGVSKAKPKLLLPMYEAPPLPTEVEPVGKYALKFHWNDGHDSGLYSWEYLRNVCDYEWKTQQVEVDATESGVRE